MTWRGISGKSALVRLDIEMRLDCGSPWRFGDKQRIANTHEVSESLVSRMYWQVVDERNGLAA